MAVVYAFLADGLEEVECLATADVLIRAGVKVKLVSITGKKEVKGAHGFGIHADTLLHEIDPMKADLLFLPGGMPGTKNLMACKPLCDALVQADAAGNRSSAYPSPRAVVILPSVTTPAPVSFAPVRASSKPWVAASRAACSTSWQIPTVYFWPSAAAGEAAADKITLIDNSGCFPVVLERKV